MYNDSFKRAGSGFITLLGFATIIALLFCVRPLMQSITNTFNKTFTEPAKATTTASPQTTPTAAAKHAVEHSAQHTSHTGLWIGLAIAGGSLLLIGLLIVISKLYLNQRATKKALKDRYVTAQNRYNKVRQAYTKYETDPSLWLSYPAITDISITATSKFFEALEKATEVEPEKFVSDKLKILRFDNATENLSKAWRVAESNARKLGVSIYTSAERKNISKAQALLGNALDESLQPTTRRNYLDAAYKLLEGIIQVPKNTEVHLELQSRKLQLTAA